MGSKSSKGGFHFTVDDIESQAGKIFIVTGANTGLGLETCKVLVSKGASVYMTVRDMEKSKDAINEVGEIARSSEGKVDVLTMDLGDIESVKKACEDFLALNLPLHCLINNAGVMGCPKQTTVDGIEQHFGANHIGHYALTLGLFPALLKAANDATSSNPVRIINLTSALHNACPKEGILFDDLNWEKRKYDPTVAYAHSKFANIVFTKALQERVSQLAPNKFITCSVHPGVVWTDLTRHYYSRYPKLVVDLFMKFSGVVDIKKGALTQLYCATSPEVVGRSYEAAYFKPVGQKGEMHSRAPKITKAMQDTLWEVSEELTGVSLPTIAKL